MRVLKYQQAKQVESWKCLFQQRNPPSDYVSRLQQELNGEHTITNYNTSDHTFFWGTYTDVPKIHINELDILRKNVNNNYKIH